MQVAHIRRLSNRTGHFHGIDFHLEILIGRLRRVIAAHQRLAAQRIGLGYRWSAGADPAIAAVSGVTERSGFAVA